MKLPNDSLVCMLLVPTATVLAVAIAKAMEIGIGIEIETFIQVASGATIVDARERTDLDSGSDAPYTYTAVQL